MSDSPNLKASVDDEVDTNYNSDIQVGRASQSPGQKPTERDPLLRDEEKTISKDYNGFAKLGCILAIFTAIGIIIGIVFYFRHAPNFTVQLDSEHLSKLDNRVYQFGKMDNGIDYLLVQDPKASKFAVSIGYNAGVFDNPRSLPGLAHFLEHMIFLGSNKFPGESNLDKFTAKYAGYSNAYTAEERTVYYFQLAHAGFSEGMSRLGAVTQYPALPAKGMGEVQAVNSEHTKNLQNPGWRIGRMFHVISDPNGFTGQFGTGNIDTLQKIPQKEGIDVHKALEEFHSKHYCPQNSVVVVYSKYDPRTMYSDLATGFDKPYQQNCIEKPMEHRGKHESRTGYFVHMYKENYPTRRLTVSFPIDFSLWTYNEEKDTGKETDPSTYLEYILNFYGKDGSGLRGILNSRALVISSDWQVDSSSFDARIDFEAEIMPDVDYNTIMSHLFAYLDQVIAIHKTSKEVPESLIRTNNFMWSWSLEDGSPADLASGWVSDLITDNQRNHKSLENFLRPQFQRVNLELIDKILTYLRYDNCNIVLSDKGPADPNTPKEAFGTEKYYQIDYALTKLPARGEKITLKGDELNFPPPYPPPPTIEKKVDELKAQASPFEGGQFGALPEEYMKSDNPLSRHWYRYGSTSSGIHYSAKYTVMLPVHIHTAKERMHLMVFATALSFYLRPHLSEMHRESLTSIYTKLDQRSHLCIDISIGGIYDDRTKTNLGKIIDIMLQGNIYSDAIQKRTLVELTNELTDFSTSGPMGDAFSFIRTARTQYQFQQFELAKIIPQDIKESITFVKDAINGKKVRIDSFVMGAIEKEQAKGLYDVVASKFEIDNNFKEVYPNKVRLEPLYLQITNPQKDEKNRVTVVLYEIAEDKVFDWKTKATASMISAILGPFTFQELRTKAEVRPYTVNGNMSVAQNRVQLFGAIQDHHMEVDAQIKTMEKHLTESFVTRIEKMQEDELEVYKKSILSQMMAAPASQGQEFGHFSSEVYFDGRSECFSPEYQMAHAIDLVEKKDLKLLYKRLINSKLKSVAAMHEYGVDPPLKPGWKTVEQVEADKLLNDEVKWGNYPSGNGLTCDTPLKMPTVNLMQHDLSHEGHDHISLTEDANKESGNPNKVRKTQQQALR